MYWEKKCHWPSKIKMWISENIGAWLEMIKHNNNFGFILHFAILPKKLQLVLCPTTSTMHIVFSSIPKVW